MMFPVRPLTLALAVSVASPVMAQENPHPYPAQGDMLEELDRRTDELSDAARRTIEEFINLVGPMLMRLSRLVEDLPAYETPEILPNGDIIIRRKPEPRTLDDTGADGLTET